VACLNAFATKGYTKGKKTEIFTGQISISLNDSATFKGYLGLSEVVYRF